MSKRLSFAGVVWCAALMAVVMGCGRAPPPPAQQSQSRPAGGEGAAAGRREMAVDLGGDVKMEFVWIPPGGFIMGSPEGELGRQSNEAPQHLVRITRGFWMGKYEVTQEQWERVMGHNPSYFTNAGKRAPVELVSWDDCQEFLKKLTAQVQRPKGEEVTFRLPTEAEWEYACRAGTRTEVYSGDITIEGAHYGKEVDEIGWYRGNSGVDYAGAADSGHWREMRDHKGAGTHPVGMKKPNAFGLYDMIGNVCEWCSDWYCWNGPYSSGPTNDPTGPSSGWARVLRGGSWGNFASVCRCAHRDGDGPTHRYSRTGFRVLLAR